MCAIKRLVPSLLSCIVYFHAVITGTSVRYSSILHKPRLRSRCFTMPWNVPAPRRVMMRSDGETRTTLYQEHTARTHTTTNDMGANDTDLFSAPHETTGTTRGQFLEISYVHLVIESMQSTTVAKVINYCWKGDVSNFNRNICYLTPATWLPHTIG